MSAVSVVQAYIDAVNSHDWDAVAQLTSPRLAGAVRDGMWRASPDLRLEPEWMIENGDTVTVWLFGTGTHTAPWALPPSAGAFAGQTLTPTGKAWRAACSVTYRVSDGKVVDVWGIWDFLGILSQLGVLTLTSRLADRRKATNSGSEGGR